MSVATRALEMGRKTIDADVIQILILRFFISTQKALIS
jgi:hypothetical protein